MKEKGDVYQSLTAKMFEMQKDKNGEVSREGEEFIAKVTGVIYAGKPIQYSFLNIEIILKLVFIRLCRWSGYCLYLFPLSFSYHSTCFMMKTVSSILTFILAMVLYPEVQERAQEELDTVLGKNILPTFEDLPKLKYIDAIRKECLRYSILLLT